MADLPVNIVDIGVALILLVSAILAFSRGLVHEVLSVAGWIGAIFATIYGLPLLRPHARNYISLEIAADLTAGVVIFVASLVILSILTRTITKRVQDSALNALDRSLGFLFGLARGAVLACLVFIVANWVWPLDGKTADEKDGGGTEQTEQTENGEESEKPKKPVWVLTSRSLPLIQQGAEMLAELVPQDSIALGQGKNKEMLRDNLDTVQTLRKMIRPDSKAPDLQAPEGYDSKSRRVMDKAFEIAK